MTVDTGRRVPTEAELADLVGTRFPGGQATLEPWWVHLVLDSMVDDFMCRSRAIFGIASLQLLDACRACWMIVVD